MLLTLVASGAIVLIAACGSAAAPSGPPSSSGAPSLTPTVESPSVSPAPSASNAGSIPPITPAATALAATPAATPAAASPLIPGIGSVTLSSAESGGGTRPELAWEPVDGATTYRVTVFDEQGRPYWAWEGAEASTFFGGGAQSLPEEAPGPILRAGMSWVVFAADAEGHPIAASAIRPLAP